MYREHKLMRYSTTIIVPAPYLDMANFLMEAEFGSGPDPITRPLYDSEGDITHYGSSANTEDNWEQGMPSIIDNISWANYGVTKEQATALLSPPFITSQPFQNESQRAHFERQAALIGVSLDAPDTI